MKPLIAAFVAALAALAVPALADAADTSVTAQDGNGARAHSPAVVSPASPFELVGLHWRGRGSVSFRTRSLAGVWSRWHPALAEPDGPDGRSGAARRGWRFGSPFWTGPADALEYRTRGQVGRVRAFFVRTDLTPSEPVRTMSLAGSPPIVLRPTWDAAGRRPARYAPAIHFLLVHHTAGSNNYAPGQSAAIVRAIQAYHVHANGWQDIGYNFLVDRYGRVFEGRYGGIERNVVGAHSQGFNYGSVGVALIGNYGSTAIPPAQRAALVKLIAWRLDVAHVDPLATVAAVSGGNPRFPAGRVVRIRAISGHRDTYPTSCPGNAAYAELPSIAQAVANTGLPKLYAPTVSGRVGGVVRFRARLSTPLPWTVTVSDAAGMPVAVGRGAGVNVDWTWDSTGEPVRPYAYAIEAGPSVRPATGTLGGLAARPILSDVVAVPRVVSPNGDGWQDTTAITYRLRARATVTATLAGDDGTPLATLFAGEQRAGRGSFPWDPAALPDGYYRITVEIRTARGRTASATIRVLVDRTLANVTFGPTVFSPNGDGRFDDVTLSFELRAPADVAVKILRKRRLVHTLVLGQLPAGSHTQTWDGLTPNGRAPDARYSLVLSAKDVVGTSTRSLPVTLDTKPPVLKLLSLPSLRFSLSELATVAGSLNDTPFRFVENPGKFTLPLIGPVSKLIVSAEDNAGNRSAPIRRP